jgi:ankyrin repeat protein
LLCEHGLNIDAKGKWKRMALHQNVYWENDRWVKFGMLDILKYLLAKGADPSLKDVDGANAFYLAKKAGNTAALKVLNSI